MDNLAKAAGVTRPVVYEHFENRDALVIALLQRHAERLRADDASDELDDSTFAEHLHVATRAYVLTVLEHGPAMRALVSGALMSPSIEQVRRQIWNEGVRRWAMRYAATFDLASRDSEALASAHLSGLSAMAGLCMEGSLSVDRAVGLHVAAVLGALEAVSGRGKLP